MAHQDHEYIEICIKEEKSCITAIDESDKMSAALKFKLLNLSFLSLSLDKYFQDSG